LMDGHIYAQKAQLLSGAIVRGDIFHGSLSIDIAAIFEGASKRCADPIADAQNTKV
jgi:cytoskeletal protein CcmA (bactofilin family)